mgnify:CR=1 FL=1|jgi:hypothetical protein
MNSLSFMSGYWTLQQIATEKVVFLIEELTRNRLFLDLDT